MHAYKAYGLTFASELPLPGLPEGSGPPDVVIRLAPLSSQELQAKQGGGRCVWGRVFNDIQFCIEDGRVMTLDIRRPIGDDVARGYVLGGLLAILLRQRGLLVLHACAVARDGAGVSFMGESGWGKSTLAEFFCQNGYDLLTDDVLAVEMGDGARPLALPSYPQIRLRPGSGAELVDDFEALPHVNTLTAKRIRSGQRVPEHAVPLRRVYVLDPTYTTAGSVEPLSGGEAVVRLLRHSRVMHVFKDPAFTSRHLAQCGQLARAVPVARLHRVQAVEALPDLLRLVEQDLGAAQGVGAAV